MYWYVQLTETLENGATAWRGDVVVYALSQAEAMNKAEAKAQSMAGSFHATGARPAAGMVGSREGRGE